ncbi:uncharacterized protein LOC119403324 [Rhipicephalus sanguineus]|uniref:uncharacterized protein LOC119403324 n=1 Tax=Rhipicephalus sanguineus TaxID=34632 RepID=UPI0020C2EAE6|nr:uncharacterized protein LOC119403324 [Rhipicephalus sanguineus]
MADPAAAPEAAAVAAPNTQPTIRVEVVFTPLESSVLRAAGVLGRASGHLEEHQATHWALYFYYPNGDVQIVEGVPYQKMLHCVNSISHVDYLRGHIRTSIDLDKQQNLTEDKIQEALRNPRVAKPTPYDLEENNCHHLARLFLRLLGIRVPQALNTAEVAVARFKNHTLTTGMAMGLSGSWLLCWLSISTSIQQVSATISSIEHQITEGAPCLPGIEPVFILRRQSVFFIFNLFTGTVEGFVDLGKFTLEEDRTTPADHGMVMMFQPFQGDWTQILGVFSSKGNIKAEMLAKLLLEAILLSEQAGLFVDFVSCDGATWNRSMWRSFGIGASSVKTTCNVTHPVDPSRKLHFCSDFPHLVKCVRNSFVSTGFTTQDGRACVEHIEAAWQKDKSSLTLKAMPHITRVHIRPNSFEKMKVNLAFTLFSD